MSSFWATEDLLLELARWLGLRDALALASTCSVIRNRMNTRDFWMLTLRETCRRFPRPYPPALDLSACGVPALRNFVRHAVVLNRKWTSSSTQARANYLFILPSGFRLWNAFNGSPHVLLISDDAPNQFSCLNFGHVGGAYSDFINIGAPNLSCMENTASGVYSLAVHTTTSSPGETNDLLSVYEVDIGTAVPSIRLVWSRSIEIDADDGDVHVFMDGRFLVGYAQLCNRKVIQVRGWNLSTATSRMVSSEIELQHETDPIMALTQLSLHGDHLRFTVSEYHRTHIYVILRPAWAEDVPLAQNPGLATARPLANTLCIRSSQEGRHLVGTHHNELSIPGLLELYYDTTENINLDEVFEDLSLRLAYMPYDAQASGSFALQPAETIVPLPLFREPGGIALGFRIDDLHTLYERGLVFVPPTDPVIRIVHFAESGSSPGIIDSKGANQLTVTTCDVVFPQSIERADVLALDVDEGLGIIFLEVQQEHETVLHCVILS